MQGVAALEEAGHDGIGAVAQPGLLPGHPHRLLVQPAERPGDLADLAAGRDLDRRGQDGRPGVRARGQRADLGGQPVLGRVQGGRLQPPQRADHGPDDEQGDQHGQEQPGQRHAAGEQRGPVSRSAADSGRRP